MLRGSSTAKIDSRGRLKVPASFRKLIEEHYGRSVFVTSLDGSFVRVYPEPVWQELEARLSSVPSMNPKRQKLLNWVNRWGQMAEMDGQGRILIHPEVRKAAEIRSEVRVLGQQKYLDVWNEEKFTKKLEEEPLTEDDFEVLSNLGV